MADGVQNTVGEQPVDVQAGISFWHTPWEFAVHGIVGTAIFAIIAVLAIALDLSIGWLETFRVSRAVIFGLEAAEYALFLPISAYSPCFFGGLPNGRSNGYDKRSTKAGFVGAYRQECERSGLSLF